MGDGLSLFDVWGGRRTKVKVTRMIFTCHVDETPLGQHMHAKNVNEDIVW